MGDRPLPSICTQCGEAYCAAIQSVRVKSRLTRWPQWVDATLGCGHTSGNVLFKHDLEGGAVEERRFEHGAAGEAVFAPASLSAGEDEGYLMAYAHDLDGGKTDLVILAAQDFAGKPVARIHPPVRVPLGFHGSWIADS